MQTAAVALPALAPRAGARRSRGRAPLCARAAANRGKPAPRDDTVQYGNDWYEQTKRLSKRKSTAETLGACGAALCAPRRVRAVPRASAGRSALFSRSRAPHRGVVSPSRCGALRSRVQVCQRAGEWPRSARHGILEFATMEALGGRIRTPHRSADAH
jgi:hypothetical protein